MIELKEFQKEAADQIAERFARYAEAPPMRGRRGSLRTVPFYQGLSSITASGKTAILADAVSTISILSPIPPVVLWLSKGKVVVDQSYANLAAGGKYNHLLGRAQFGYLASFDAVEVREATDPLVFFATVGTFNQKDKEGGGRLIFRSEIDTAEDSTWEALKLRADSKGNRRPLLIVYDEGHNLTDQQIGLLLELEPDGLIAASATMRRPAQLEAQIRGLREEGWSDEDLVTVVDSKAVADSGLVKSRIQLAGYQAPMEETVDALIADLEDADQQAAAQGIGRPKAIYVCRTNIVEGDSGRIDDPNQPFTQRRSPPILIWRHLTERCGVDPADIAVYLTLKTSRDYPLPSGFRLFKGGEKDYEEFMAGDFQHVIFNLSLQEGWDDPLAYFAYIDKSMESRIQVEQMVGRLLRQPGAKHYPSERLNTAHFYIRVDRERVFGEIIEKVNQRLSTDAPEIRIVETRPDKPKPEALPPRETKTVFETAYVPEHAVEPIEKLIQSFTDYRNDDGTNVESAGSRALIQRQVGEDAEAEFVWEEFEHSNLVVARWLFQREVMRRFKGALDVAPTDDPKFDARVGFGSRAHTQIKQLAKEVVGAYLENVELKQKAADGYEVGPALVRSGDMDRFENSVHEGYSDLNDLERACARAIDQLDLTWCRNPSRSGYGIPLVSIGPTRNFYPDFVVWRGDDVFALDTTGGHLLREKTNRKLLSILPAKGAGGRLWVRFISEGRWNREVEQEDADGYTVWGRKPDGSLRTTHLDSIEAAVERAIDGEPGS